MDGKYLTLRYSNQFYSNSEEAERYVHECRMSVFESSIDDDERNPEVLVGKVSVKLFLCLLAANSVVPFSEVLDYYSADNAFGDMLLTLKLMS